MKFTYLLIISLLLIACEGPVGPQGLQGEPGPGTRTVISGPVAFDEMFITINDLSESDLPIIDVFICPPTFSCVPLPFTVFTNDVADFTTNFQPTNGGIWLQNAIALYEAWGTTSATYVIVMVE